MNKHRGVSLLKKYLFVLVSVRPEQRWKRRGISKYEKSLKKKKKHEKSSRKVIRKDKTSKDKKDL